MQKEQVEVFNQHSEKIKILENDVTVLKCDVNEIKNTQNRMDERLVNIEKGQHEVINTVLSSNNAILQSVNSMTQTMSQIVISLNEKKTEKEVTQLNNDTQLEITKQNNKSTLIKQLLIVGGAFFGGSKIGTVANWIKDLFN